MLLVSFEPVFLLSYSRAKCLRKSRQDAALINVDFRDARGYMPSAVIDPHTHLPSREANAYVPSTAHSYLSHLLS